MKKICNYFTRKKSSVFSSLRAVLFAAWQSRKSLKASLYLDCFASLAMTERVIMKILITISITLLLPGCIPAVFVAGAAAGGAVIYDHRDTKTMVKDRDATFQIQNNLDQDKDLFKKTHISIVTFNRIGLLVGQAPNEEQRAHAETIAKANSQVKILYNEITTESPISSTQITNDMWITTKIKTTLMATPGLSSTNLKIITENGTVYLMGLTTLKQADLATEKVKTISGVKKIVKLFEYLG
jgi:osmotically-inducible protein OsmY